MKALIVSDIHFHAWSMFAQVLPSGVNSRLQYTIDELHRAARTLVSQGGSEMIIAGDVFHTRGSLDPEVLNAVRDCISEVVAQGVSITIIPGNHDLKSDDTVRLSSAVQNLEQLSIDGKHSVEVINQVCLKNIGGQMFGFVPWRNTKEALLADLENLSLQTGAGDAHVFIHAGIDGVLSGIPGGGLTPQILSNFDFKSVFAGHYHNSVDLSAGLPNRIRSIGATTHHNWGDVGTKAGFLILDTDTDSVDFFGTQAPQFVDISGMDEDDIQLAVPGNYARFRGPQMTQEQINELRSQLVTWGALGVSIDVPRKVETGRSTAPATGLTLEQSVSGFVDTMKDVPAHVDRAKVAARAQDVLSGVRSASSE